MSVIPKNIYKTAPSLHPKLKKLYLNTELQILVENKIL